MEVSLAFIITSSCLVTWRQLSLCQSHLRLLKLCHAWKLSQSSLSQMLKNQTNAAAPGSPFKVLLLLLHSRLKVCRVTSAFSVHRPSRRSVNLQPGKLGFNFNLAGLKGLLWLQLCVLFVKPRQIFILTSQHSCSRPDCIDFSPEVFGDYSLGQNSELCSPHSQLHSPLRHTTRCHYISAS